jgi:L-iditol 2-dehydrogenase
MKALVKYAPGDGNVEIQEVEEPCCNENQVKLEIAYCGICGTDLHVLHDTFTNYPPVILGHEFCGTVVEIGKNAGTALKEGDKVAGLGATAIRCGRCTYCLSGNFIFCSARRGMGHGVNGAFARYVVMRPDQLFRIPPSLTMEEAALSEPFAAVVHAVTEISPVRVGQVALVSGPGPMGLLCVKLLVAQGVATIVAGTDRDEERLRAALRFGAVAAVNTGEQDLREAIRETTGGAGVDAAFECAGHEDSIRGCLESLRPMGHHTQVGVCGHDVRFPMDLIFSKRLTLAGSICYTERTWDRMMQIFAGGRPKLDDLISHKLPISQWREAFELCKSCEALKVLMYPVD